MYALKDNTAPPSRSSTARPTRATLRARPRIQRTLIRSWEYIRPIRVTILAIRLLVVLWLFVLCSVLDRRRATPGAGFCCLPPWPCLRSADAAHRNSPGLLTEIPHPWAVSA